MNNLVDIVKNTEEKNYDSILTVYAKNNNVNITLKSGDNVEYYQGNPIFISYYFEEDSLVELREIENAESIMIKNKMVVNGQGNTYKIQLTETIQSLKEAKGIAFSLLPYSLLMSLLFALMFSYIFSKKMTRPLKLITERVNEMNNTKKDIRIDINNDDEIGQLAKDINSLYSTLLKLIEDYKSKNQEILDIEKERLTFIRATSHELKTPLAKLSVLTENMLLDVGKYKDHKKYLEESMHIINELSDMITDILKSVKTTGFAENTVEKISVKKILEEIIDSYEILVVEKNMRFAMDLRGDFLLEVNGANMKKVLSNIISNAIKYGIKDREIKVYLDDEKLVISNEYNCLLEEDEDGFNGVKNKSSKVGLAIVGLILDSNNINYDIIIEDNVYSFIVYSDAIGSKSN